MVAVARDVASGTAELGLSDGDHVGEAVLSASAETLLGGSEDGTAGDERKCVLHCDDDCVNGRCLGVGYQIVIVYEER